LKSNNGGFITRQINSDWEKPRRFALRLFPAGYLRVEPVEKVKYYYFFGAKMGWL
jgi:hypothetical protein